MNSNRKQVRNGAPFSNSLGHIAVCRENFVILDNGHNLALVFNLESGRCMATIGSRGVGPGAFGSLTGAAFNGRGELYVSDALLGRIQVFDTSGVYVRLFSGRVECPRGLAFTLTDNLIVCDSQKNQVRIFDEYGRLACAFGSFGSKPGEFDGPRAVCVARDGKIIVADSGNSRVQIFDCQGGFLGLIEPFQHPLAVAVGRGGEIAVVDFHHTSSNVHVYSAVGELLYKIQCPKEADAGPRGIALDGTGRLIVAYNNMVDIHQLF
jgi:DNA-binding beta-propeller fold protein YncE